MDTDRMDETRSLVISDFRNLGVSAYRKSKDEKTILKINRSLKKDELGGLVIILGGNNCGKSNVLDAVTKYPKQISDPKEAFEPKDMTDFLQNPKRPELVMDVAGGRYGDITPPKIALRTIRCKIKGKVPDVLLYILRQRESFSLFNDYVGQESELWNNVETYLNMNEELIRCNYSVIGGDTGAVYAHILRNRENISGENLGEIINALESGDLSQYIGQETTVLVKGTPIDSAEIVGFEKRRVGDTNIFIPRYVSKDRLDEYYSNQGIKEIAMKAVGRLVRGRKQHDPIGDLEISDLTGGVKETEVVPDSFSQVYGYNLSNNVYKYSQRKITESDLTTSVDDINPFINNLFLILGYEDKDIINKYYEKRNNRTVLEDKLNNELKPISDKLNRLLNSNEKEYKMKIRLEKSEISLALSSGGINLNLDHQSDGFRWLFGFFMTFLMSKKFVAGDIVVIDEFGGLLNFGTVRELTDILREFSKKNGITFIIATQNPIAVDIDHLDEVRMVVPRKDGGSDILNDFNQFGKEECMDVLRPIVASMTVGRNYLRSENRTTIFVEGYRDYFYLNGFKELLKEEKYDVDFIPVNGITENTSAESLSNTLRSIEHNPILLVDDNVSDSIGEPKGVTVLTVSEQTGMGSVMDLFSDEDKKRLSVEDASFDHAACLSYSIPTDDEITEETKENFRKLLGNISLG